MTPHVLAAAAAIESAPNLAAVGLPHYLVLGVVLFALGLFTVVTRKNAVAMLMGVELMLNAAGLNFVAFAHFGHGHIQGHIFAIIIIVMAAAEAAVALAIVLAVHRAFGSVDATQTTTLSH